MSFYQSQIRNSPYAQAALAVTTKSGRYLRGVELQDCANYLFGKDAERFEAKGKRMGYDHLKQEAVVWARRNVDK